jgi:uncharacterized PurR-regulated membrane protein YhhQ (DUF165 family)
VTPRDRTVTLEGAAYFLGFIGSIWLANWLITHWGTVKYPDSPYLIPVWPGALTPSGEPVYAPSGVLAIGLSFTLRDLVQRRLGVRVAMLAIVLGAVVSAALDPALALASGAALLLAESLDLVVYTPLQRRNLVGAVVASNVVGIVVDSLVFVSLAFGSLALLEGQIIGKAWMTLAAIPLVYGIRAWDQMRGMGPHDIAATRS